jgi:choice-of-anchor B domain-containing protein
MHRRLAFPLLMLTLATLLPAAAGAAAVPCVGGLAGIYPCDGIDLLAQVPLASMGGGNGNDIWGWTDPVTGVEYALMGRTNGTAFVDISDPENPVYVGNLPTQTVSSSWRDIKAFADHAFIVADSAGSHGMQIFDLSQLRAVTSPPVTFSATAVYTGFGSAHNVAINEATGYAYAVDSGTCSNGLHMIDISTPTSPVFAGCHGADGAIHDAQCVSYIGPDPDHQGAEVCITATLTGDTMDIIDVTNKSATVTLSKNSYPGAITPHQEWFSPDHRYVYHGDESDESSFGHNTRTYIFDVTDLDNPVLLGDFTNTTAAIDHNMYARGDFLYQANYTSGLRILDTSGVATASLTEAAFFDTRPETESAVFQGAWSTYPFFASCSVVVSDIQRGLFVLGPTVGCTCGNGVVDPGEECDGSDFGGLSCSDFACSGGTLSCDSCTIDPSACTGCPTVCGDGTCDLGEDCNACPADCPSFPISGAACGNGLCEAGDGEDCVSCPQDCNGVQKGKPANRFCCGFGGTNPVGCGSASCTSGGFSCTETPVGGGGSTCCGDLSCEAPEDSFNCPLDCGAPPQCGDASCDAGEDECSCAADCGVPPASEAGLCTDGIDNDCGGGVDCGDADCATDPACICQPKNASCTQGSECCSGICKNNGRCR